jgi:hypothetical protein
MHFRSRHPVSSVQASPRLDFAPTIDDFLSMPHYTQPFCPVLILTHLYSSSAGLSRALESFGLTLLARDILPQSWVPRRLDVIMFSAAAAAICHCYADHFGARRNVFKSKYLEVFDFVLGNSGFDAGIITHAPSNAQLVTMASDKLLRSVRSVSNLKSLRHNWSSIGSTEVDGAVDVLGMEGREVGGAVDGDDEDARASGEAQQRRKLD